LCSTNLVLAKIKSKSLPPLPILNAVIEKATQRSLITDTENNRPTIKSTSPLSHPRILVVVLCLYYSHSQNESNNNLISTFQLSNNSKSSKLVSFW
jgi:hypothetical protein